MHKVHEIVNVRIRITNFVGTIYFASHSLSWLFKSEKFNDRKEGKNKEYRLKSVLFK